MAPVQSTLASLWHDAPEGRLSPLEQMRAVCLRDAQMQLSGKVNHAQIASSLCVKSNDKRRKVHPNRDSVRVLLEKVDADKDWYPGKTYQTRFGPAPLLTAQKRKNIAKSMMATKEEGEEPSYDLAIQRCPKATLNPVTQLPFTEKYIRKVFTEDCYDVSPKNPWRFQRCLQKTWLPSEMRDERRTWACNEIKNARPGVWYFNNIIWFDPCSKIIPAGPKKAADQKQAEKGDMRYVSDDAREYSRNLKGPKYAKTQKGWGDQRYHWVLVLTRGVADVEVPGRSLLKIFYFKEKFIF